MSNNNHYKFDEGETESLSTLPERAAISKFSVILKNGLVLPHECTDIFDDQEFINKYTRRIERFQKIVKNNTIKKIFVISSDKKLDVSRIEKILNNYCSNFIILTINYSEYQSKCKDFEWTRSYIDWSSLFNKN